MVHGFISCVNTNMKLYFIFDENVCGSCVLASVHAICMCILLDARVYLLLSLTTTADDQDATWQMTKL